MATADAKTLVKLSDIDETVADREEDIRGRNVKDRNGEDIGKVDELMIDSDEHKVRFLEVASGGFLGIGQDKTFIPVDAITAIDADEVHIDQTREHVAGAPAYDPDLVDQTPYYESVYGYYGVTPFWGAGYVYPGYPFYP